MGRPSRCRRICLEPEYREFIPGGRKKAEQVLLSVDEFEAIRLIDHEKQTHEQCARQMKISRTTVTEMYERARGKIADCLVNGKSLYISGGNYEVCAGTDAACCGRRCRKRFSMTKNKSIRKEGSGMKIAVTYENGEVFQHFGHTEEFKVYDVENGAITGAQVISTNGSGHGALAALLSELGVDVLICGGIGAGAQNALAEAGIRLFGGVSGDADGAVNAFLSDTLDYDPDARCEHHEHEHDCGEHRCGENKHGCQGN